MAEPDATDPFNALANTDRPMEPRARFAAQLKQRLIDQAQANTTQATREETRLMATTKSDTKSDTESTTESTTETASRPTPGWITDATGGVSNLFYFTVPAPDLERSKAFYGAVFGWEVEGGSLGGHIPAVTPAGGLNPSATSPDERTVYIAVDDIEAATARVVELGGTVEGDIEYFDPGAMARCRDDQGTSFSLQQPGEGDYAEYARNPQKGSSHGDLFYWSLPVQDGAAGRAFYSALFGWDFGSEGSEGGMHAENMVTDGGIGAGRHGDRVDFYFRVDDAASTAEAIRTAGGDASDPMDTPQGIVVDCTDDQGVKFGLVQPADGF